MNGDTSAAILEQLICKYNKATITPEQFAHEAGLSVPHVRRMCQAGRIGAVHIGKVWAIPTVEAAAVLSGTKADKPASPYVG